jgi:hypothetical protein
MSEIRKIVFGRIIARCHSYDRCIILSVKVHRLELFQS